VAGVVRDRLTGKPVRGALVSRNVWRDHTVDETSSLHAITPDLRDRSDAWGRFVISGGRRPAYFQPWNTGISCGGDSDRVEILIRAPGYVPVVASAPLREDDREGHAFLVALDRPLTLVPRVRDRAGGPIAHEDLAWMLLNDRHPFLEGRARTDERGCFHIRSDFIAHLRRMELIVWTRNSSLSGRRELEALDASPGRTLPLELELGPDAPRFDVDLPLSSPYLFEMAERSRTAEFGRPRSASPNEFRLWVIGPSAHPGPPFHLDSDDSRKPHRIRASSGRNYIARGLSPASLHYRSICGDRPRLDLSPARDERWLELAPDGRLLRIQRAGGSGAAPSSQNGVVHWTRDAAAAIAGRTAHSREKGPQLAGAAWARVRGLPKFRDAELLVDVLAPVRREQVRRDDHDPGEEFRRTAIEVDQARGEALIPHLWAEPGRRLVLSRSFSFASRAEGARAVLLGSSSALDSPHSWPRLVELVATDTDGIYDFRALPAMHRVTLRVVDGHGRPCPDVLLAFPGSPASFGRQEFPAGRVTWGLARDAETGLPHATMMTDQKGEVRLRQVPEGIWHLRTAHAARGSHRHRIEICRDRQLIELEAPEAKR
jgi:hypothetical protein